MNNRFFSICFSLTAIASSATGEPYRPSYHFTPAKNWMNDPNGMVWHDGEWHLFYQYNPSGDKWGHMSWGHAVSRNLLTWEHLPLALAEENGIMIFSGSAVVDEKNTSGFGKDGRPPMVAIYTAHTDKNQSQALAFSNDRGRIWTKFSGNPVLDIGAKDFRDPKIIWHEPTHSWIMTVSWPMERKVRFYRSPDLKQWTHLSDFGPAGSVSGIWECPDLLPLKVEGGGEKWLLIVNVGSGAPAGGSGGQYFVGDFDGKSFAAHGPSTPAGTLPVEAPGKVFADFEHGYGDWKAIGDCFGEKPASGAFEGQHPVPGFRGHGFVNTFLKGDRSQGTLTSPDFLIDHSCLNFLIGGGAHAGRTCVNLKVDGRVVQTATGRDDERLDWVSWKLDAWRGKQAQIEIVDAAVEGWGHVNADHFMLGEVPAQSAGEAALWLDHGPDFYAGITWSGGPPGDNRRILLGWMSNWQYANDVPTSPWRSAMSVPRELSLRKIGEAFRLVQQPVREIGGISDPAKVFAGGSVEAANAWLAKEKVMGDKLDLTFTLRLNTDKAALLELFKDDEAATRIVVDGARGLLTMDRTKSGMIDFNPQFSRIASAPLWVGPTNEVTLRVLLDACSVEVFSADGLTALTTLVFPHPNARKVRIAEAAIVKSITVRAITDK